MRGLYIYIKLTNSELLVKWKDISDCMAYIYLYKYNKQSTTEQVEGYILLRGPLYIHEYKRQSTTEQVGGYILLRGPLYIHRNHFLNIQAEGFLPVSFFPFLFLSSKGNNEGPDAVYQADKTIISHAISPPDLETIPY